MYIYDCNAAEQQCQRFNVSAKDSVSVLHMLVSTKHTGRALQYLTEQKEAQQVHTQSVLVQANHVHEKVDWTAADEE